MIEPSDTVTVQSRLSFAETVAGLSHAIAAAGSTIFATIDQSAAASGAGLTLAPTTLVVFGNPKAGTALMEAFPLCALDLPLKVLVWQRDEHVNVSYVAAVTLARRYGVRGMEATIAAMDRAFATLIQSVART